MVRAEFWILLALAAVPTRAEWIRIRTPRMELLTDAGEKSAMRTLDRLAAVRQVLGEGQRTERPLRIFLFSSEREFHSYTQGSTTEGFFQSGPERDYIVLPAGAGLTRTAAHEYVHRILNRGAPRFPRWLDEGLAEFYSTLEVNGHSAVVGEPIEAHWAVLRATRLLPQDELESISTASAYANERALAGIFYAQSWALVHLLKLSPEWRGQTPVFLASLATGREPSQAFREAYGRTLEDAIHALPGYLAHLRAARFEIPPGTREEVSSVDKLDSLTATLERADLALHAARFDLARKLFEDAARSHPDSPEAEAGLGTLAMAQDRREDAQVHLRRATELHAPGGEIYFEIAMLEQDKGAPPAEIDQALERALAVNPEYAEAHLFLGQREADRGDYAHAIPHLQTAARILPRQSYIWHALAYAQAKAGQNEAALDSARRALQTARSPDHERMARVLLQSLE